LKFDLQTVTPYLGNPFRVQYGRCVVEDNLLETANLSIQVLGHFQVWYQGDLLVWPTQKSKALFQILLIEPGRLVPTDQLMDYLWPDLPPSKAKNNLWVTISQLRHVLEPGLPARARSAYVLKQGEGYRFNSESDYWLDCELFTTNLTVSQSAANVNESIAVWEAALNLYQGDYIEDEPYAEWVQHPRAQWRRRYEQLLTNLADAYGQNGNFHQAITHCRKALALDNTNETVYRLLMRCHVSLGERGPALKVYNEVVQVLQDEIGVDPMRETKELALQIEQLEGDWRFEVGETQVSSPFIGRRKEIDLFTQLLTQTATGQGRVLIFTGEPGIGKTRLIQETTRLASRKGFQSLTAQCYQMEQALPYQPVIDLARQMMEYDSRWQQLATVWLRELALLVPEMEEVAVAAMAAAPPSDELDESQQGRLFQAIFHLFANKADQHKLLLVVEDIQWADITTLQCLHYLARHIMHVPIALIFTLREESLSTDTDLAALLDNLRREVHAKSLSLSRLTRNETNALLMKSADTAPYSDRLGQWLYQETAGHPFFFTSLLQSLREEGLLDNAAATDWQMLARTDPGLALPDAIRDSVLSRLRRLLQTEREVLDWMAVYGRSLDFSTLQAINSQPRITLLNAVEKLAALQLLEDSMGQYDFNHNKISEVVYHELSATRRTLYHRQIGTTLEKLTSSTDMVAVLAYHFERGEENEKALVYWMQAGEHALETYAYEPAAYHFERALALADQPSAQMDAYLGLGRTLILLDDHEAAAGVIQQGLNLAAHHSDDIRRAKLLYANAQNASRQHRPDGGETEVETALLAAEQAGDDYHLAQSLLLLTEVHESNGNLISALETATRAQIVSSQLNDSQLEARALVEIGFLYAQQAEFDEAASAAERGLEVLERTDDHNAIAYTWNILGRALGGRGDYGRALDAFQHSQKEAERIGDRYLLAQALNMRGWLFRELGDYENGLKFDQEGVEFAQQWGKASPEISARLNVCLDVLHLGNPGQALKMLNKIETQINAGAFGFHNWRWRLRLLHARGLCYLALDEPARSLALAEEGLLSAETTIARKYVALNHELRGKALAELGSIDKAIAALEAAVELADTIQYQPIRWGGRHQLAELYKQKGRERETQQTSSEAEDIIHAIADALEDEPLRNTFLNAALPR
jgi:predicted ATPase/DNA-binding SARP family transcriptional activator